MMKVNYIIVGLGLAGIAFVEQLLQHGQSFIVYENNSQKSSRVAGGTYNPVILKRFTPVWNGHSQLEKALPFYKALEDKLGVDLDTSFITKKIFTSIADQNNWFSALDKPMLSRYMNPKISKEPLEGIHADFGCGEVKGTGRIDTERLLNMYRGFLEDIDAIRYESFSYNDVDISNTGIVYQDITTRYVVFCEGFGLKKNQFFNYLPLNGTKGETLTIHAPELRLQCLLKASVFILPLGNDFYKVGATFNWDDKTEDPTVEGRYELEDKLKKIITVPYTVTEQASGIRPTVKDRRPLVGKHPMYSNLAILNGMGTRGVMIAPTAAEALYRHLEHDEALDKDIDIKRFREL
mgnify:CR=1 FL=1